VPVPKSELSRRSLLGGGLASGVSGFVGSRPSTTTKRKAGDPLAGWERVVPDHWPTPHRAMTAQPKQASTTAFRQPDRSSGGVTLTDRQTVFGKVCLLITDQYSGNSADEEDWVQVLMPARPNGTVGWIPAAVIDVVPNPHRIVIELATNTLTWSVDNKVRIRERVSTGTGNTPTPIGLFAVKEVVPQTDVNTVVGPVALGLTAFSEVLLNYAGGQGTVAIHGTNAPGKLGSRVSKGCIRLSNPSIVKVAAEAPLGTPVEIVNRISDLPRQRWTYRAPTQSSAPPSTKVP
jgi:hypothetical protein